jgi:hypothetical protein
VSRAQRAQVARARSSAAKYRPDKKGTGTGEGLKTLGWEGGCWCGQPNGHTWPGKDKGSPHPR